MKIKVYNEKGEKGKEIELPIIFNTEFRPDLIQKIFRIYRENSKQPYGNYVLAGKEVSASGKIKHRRHKWKTAYGHGIARIPRKIMTRRGERFFWVGAFVPNTVGGFRTHPPKVGQRKLRINKKEVYLALKSDIAATSKKDIVLKRYENLNDLKIDLPVVINTEKIKKAKEFKTMLLKIFDDVKIFKEKKIRPGRGKRRGRKYKQNAGLLVIIGSKENLKFANVGVDIVNLNKLSIENLSPGGVPGRLTVYTEQAMKEIGEFK
ncbi:50S ribosomal protein L4 [Candidatus Pacearchaeota archaeon CG_4_9_14_3_um_filter_31_7]|nr:MAG: 50S ribosomal protein L4 [Candidatus Pacearchaeota archaeon CG1_02_31_27]PIN92359.1 MAG: 50S ribosomal protein L4 [Candidatus Pacearchaeota archaeon CG10_big_fil_rev_8_21_14_0_10_31_59]PIZ80661.1 MAG: 50S ribosomal protein L4 [Candidatus Pacearchaeota archaeon CG_4_10_14_0_2_um_filter_31_10]PJA70634.1 MAG: 50S ribosomal protein L4 [Candidatus Pacearchaeota archaeon CG_4_9_14_3_um_filter_31_7]